MLQNIPYHIRFIAILLLAAVFALLLRPILKKKQYRAPKATAATAWLVCGGFFLSWFVCAFGITWMTARDYLDLYQEKSGIYHTRVRESLDLDNSDAIHLGGTAESGIWHTLAFTGNNAYKVNTSGYGMHLSSESDILDWQSAAAVYDQDKNLIASSGDFLTFSFDYEDYWNTMHLGSSRGKGGTTKVDLDFDALTETARADGFYDEDHKYFWYDFFSMRAKVLRFTGVFDGKKFDADRIEFIKAAEFDAAVRSREPNEHYFEDDGTEVTKYEYTYNEVISTENLTWYTLYDSGTQTDGAITIYAVHPTESIYDEGDPLCYKDTEYNDFIDLLLAQGASDDFVRTDTKDIFDLIAVQQSYFYDYDRPIEDAGGGITYPASYYVTTVVRCSPLRSALNDFKGFYLITFLIAAALALLSFFTLRRRLLLPMFAVNDSIENEFKDIYRPEDFSPGWQESAALIQNYSLTQDKLRMRQNEITRLNTALEYARDAEQNRRQMVSAVAHELKTPLAVIHSYAEGLKEHIAEDKRDKYIDVILAESEHLDETVLELLDLSRLEAGRVKLAPDAVSLNDLTHNVFERLDMAARAKELNITFDLPEVCTVQADEARIKQVIENFASNAVKYTPAGGSIRVTATRQEYRTRPTMTTFAIENDSPPLSDEALSKVWETFYRTDDSRSGGGTGLGLAIAKNIVELHGGSCGVRNTETGVEFKFTL